MNPSHPKPDCHHQPNSPKQFSEVPISNSSASVPLFRRAWFWISLALLSAVCAALSYQLFPRIFPIVSLDIRVDRAHAIRAARELATAQKWGPPDSVRDAVSFGGEEAAQAFIELEGGGKTAFASLLHDDLYSPYAWRVRLFKESEKNQTTVRFKPNGALYDFEETLRQQAPGAALTAERARAIAETAVRAAPWQIPLVRFQSVETSQVVRPGGRIDHTFVYERPDRQLGEGRLRLRLVVSGDRLTSLKHFVKIPEAFTRRYEQMRSANNAIAMGGGVTLMLLYILGGCVGGFLFLMRQRAVLWRQPLIFAGVVAILSLLAGLNAWPLAWLNYDTALSAGSFVTERVVMLAAGTLTLGFVFFLSFLAAEGLSRRAFPQHPQFWRLWSREGAPSFEILGRTMAGYLLAPVGLLYVVVFYYFAIRQLGWWSPSEALVNPDSLSHYWPWLTPLANAAQAGIWEETLYRAVPLAGAALLGNRFGGRKWWITAAFLLQAVVFAAGHANYPGQPAYSRLVELILPSFIFGALYLRFGLLPAMVLHFTYDVVLMSLPLFAASASGIWLDRTLVVLLTLLPLWIVLWHRWRGGQWRELPSELRNEGWQPPEQSSVATVTTPPITAPAFVSDRLFMGVLGAGLLGLAAWFIATPFAGLGAPLKMSRSEAIQAAQSELVRRNAKLPAFFRADATVGGRPDGIDRFAWQTAGHDGYKALLGLYVPEARWHVRFATFQGDVAERAEEWNISVAGDGRVLRVAHRLPEARAGATLSEADARLRAHAILREKWGADPAALKEISATSAKRPARTDWTFVFQDPAIKSLSPGQARLQVELAGDEVTDAFRFVFVPEDWERADKALQSNLRTGSVIKGVVTAILILTGVGVALVAWSRKKLAGRFALTVFGILFPCSLVITLNRWPATVAHFSTAQPLELQRITAIVGPLVVGLCASVGIALLAGLVVRWLRPSPADPRRAMLLGSATGVAVIGGLALAVHLRGDVAPNWPSYDAAGTYVAWLAPVLGAIMQFFSRTAVLLFVFAALDRAASGWQRQRTAVSILAFVACALLLPIGGGASVGWWLASTAAAAFVVSLIYLVALRHDLTVLPLAIGISGALTALAGGVARAHPGALPAAVFTTVVLLALGWWTTLTLRRIAAAATAEAKNPAT